MPVLSVYLGSSVISAGLIHISENENPASNAYATLPYPLLNMHSHSEKQSYLSAFLTTFVNQVSPSTNYEKLEKKYVSLFDTQLVAIQPNLINISEIFLGDTQCIFCANSFYMSGSKFIYANPYLKNSTTIYNEEEKLNIISNIDVYPFSYPSDEFSKSLYDDSITYIKTMLSPKPQQKKHTKPQKMAFSKTHDLIFTGDRFCLGDQSKDSLYALMFSLIEAAGIYKLQIDVNNVTTHRKNIEKQFGTLSVNQTSTITSGDNIKNVGTLVKVASDIECYFETELGTKQIFQIPLNKIQIIPLAAGEKAKILIKGTSIDSFETQVEGGELGVVFLTYPDLTDLFSGIQSSLSKDVRSAVRSGLAQF